MKVRLSFFLSIIAVLVVLNLTSCKSSTSTQQAIQNVENETPKPILVDLKGRVDPLTVVNGLKKYELEVVKPINKELNQWLFSYNPEIVSADEILKILKYEQWMDDAWFYEE